MARTPKESPPAPVHSGSVLDSLRHNQVGALAAGAFIAVSFGLLLSVLIPTELSSLPLILLGTLVAAAVGVTMRHLSLTRGVSDMIGAAVLTVISIHLMTVVGYAQRELPGIAGVIEGLRITFDDALLVALATPALATGPILAGLVAAIIVGWGRPNASA